MRENRAGVQPFLSGVAPGENRRLIYGWVGVNLSGVDQAITIPVTLRPSRVRTAFLLFGSALFIVGGVFMVLHGKAEGYLCIAFFTFGLLIFGARLHPRAVYLHLAEESFTYCGLLRARTVRWAQVQEFVVIRVGRSRMVGWSFVPDPSAGKTRDLSKTLAGCEGALPDTYGLKPRQLAEVLNDLLSRSRQTHHD